MKKKFREIIGGILICSPVIFMILTEFIEDVQKYGLLMAILLWLIVVGFFLGLPALGFYIIISSDKKKEDK